MFLNKTSLIDANKIMIAMFIKLFATNMVANNFCGFCRSLETISIGLDFFSSSESMSNRVRENKATSAPEIKAEHNNSISKSAKPDTTDASMALILIIKL